MCEQLLSSSERIWQILAIIPHYRVLHKYTDYDVCISILTIMYWHKYTHHDVCINILSYQKSHLTSFSSYTASCRVVNQDI